MAKPAPNAAHIAAAFALALLIAPQTTNASSPFMQVIAEARADFTVVPLHGGVTQGFGTSTRAGAHARFHRGIDIRAPEGAAIVAPAAGRVSRVEHLADYGTMVEIDHGDGLLTRYAHLSAVDVQEGQAVSAGQTIARVGHTGLAIGSHLHFEVATTRLHEGQPYFIDPVVVLPN